MTTRGGRLLASAVALLVLAGCTGVASTSSPSASTTGTGPLTPAPPVQPTIALGSPTVGPYGLAIDPSLLSILPPTLGDLAVAESADVESQVLADPELPKHAAAYAGAVVGDLGGSDWATVSVVKLKPASLTDAYYKAWRSDYDTAACDQAGGVAAEEALQAGARSVQHVTCEGGVDIYHAQLTDRAEIVSVTSLGPLDLGLQIVQGLHT